MVKKFFLRNDSETIKNAASMTEAEFIQYYSNTMSTPEALKKAYNEMNKKVKNNQPSKRDADTPNDEPITTERIDSDGDKITTKKFGSTVCFFQSAQHLLTTGEMGCQASQ